jgi:retron-type reverse transcriptase
MGDLDLAYESSNLRRAWRWTKSNPDSTYKVYFRSLYTAYAVSDDDALIDLGERLRRGIYEPAHASKLYFPKASGILRPYTLLTVEDQIVYQALVNVVAEKVFPRVRRRYLSEVFGHLYGGKRSAFFYRKWDDGYSKMNAACRTAFKKGLTFGATFDLTACFDSLDHGVLRHFLRRCGLDDDFTRTLTDYLSRWTATNHRIYHNHGIPQGPLPSGLLAEVALQHFDAHRGSPKMVRYIRYVDDIRLYAKSPDALRRMLIRLDMLSKDIGLFPQSSKVHIHRIKDIEEELKSVSNPPEPVLKPKVVNQERLRKRLVELTPRFRVTSVTRFKYLLGCAEPSHKLNDRIWRVYDSQPELYGSVLRYFRRYNRLPPKVATRMLMEIEKKPLYHAVHADMILTADGRLSPRFQTRLNRIIETQWSPRLSAPDLLAALGRAALRHGLLTYAQTRHAATSVADWWVRSQLLESMTSQFLGEPSLESIVNGIMRHDAEGDVCMMAAQMVEALRIAVKPPTRDLHRRAALVLREYGHIRRASGRPCDVNHSLVRLIGRAVVGINWRRFFGARYEHAERQAVSVRALSETNITAFVPALDVFDDLLLDSLYRLDPSLGSYKLGNIGAVMSSTRMQSSYPHIHKLVATVHEKRLESELAHPIVRKTGKPTGRIRYTFLRQAVILLRAACGEIKARF